MKDNSTPDKKVLLHVNSSGKVGIGTINPTDKLHVEEGYLKARIFPPDDVTQGLAGFSLESRELGGTLHTWKLHTAPAGGGHGVPANGIGWWEYNDPDGDGNLCEVGELCAGARLFLQANTGNVGIGTTNPSRNLEIYRSGAESAIRINGDVAQQQALYFYDGATSYAWYKPASTNTMRLWSATYGDLITFLYSGNVGIGTTNPTYKLDVAGPTRVTGDLSVAGNFGNTGYLSTANGAAGIFGGVDLKLGGRSGGYARALVDMGSQVLQINYANDFYNGVEIVGTTRHYGTVDMMGNNLCLSGVCSTTWPTVTGVPETDPTVLASVKDGIVWTEVGGIPSTLTYGGGPTNKISKWIGGNTIGDSLISDDGTYVGINTPISDPRAKLQSTTWTSDGIGVFGLAADSTINATGLGTAGVYGKNQTRGNSSSVANGVVGDATKTIGVSRGVVGQTHSTDVSSAGVLGKLKTDASSGRAIWGEVADDGTGIAGYFYGRNSNGIIGTGVAGHFEGKVEIQGSLFVNGQQVTGSSRTIKKDIANISNEEALAALESLSPVRFKYIEDVSDDETLGFIAEDVPDLVATQDRKGLNPMDLIAVLTKVVQQQQKEIEELKTLINNKQ